MDKARFGLPEYLKRSCPCSLREGRRLKTKFRVGCHPLRSSAARVERVRNATCPCCDTGVSETIHHTLFECKAFSDERDTFLASLAPNKMSIHRKKARRMGLCSTRGTSLVAMLRRRVHSDAT